MYSTIESKIIERLKLVLLPLGVLAVAGALIATLPRSFSKGQCYVTKNTETWEKPTVCRIKVVGKIHYVSECVGPYTFGAPDEKIDPKAEIDQANEITACPSGFSLDNSTG